jgi:hypothetical protein
MTNLADQASDGDPAGEAGWRAVGKLPPSSLGAGRLLALNIAQWPARIANSYVAGTTLAERMCLQWNVAEGLLVTRSFNQELAVALNPATLEMWFLAKGRRVPHTFDPEGRSPAEAEAWVLVELLHRGIEPAHFAKTLPYDLPDLMSGDAEQYSPQSCAVELFELAAWYHNAATSFVAAAADLGAATPRLACNPQDLTMRCNLEVGEASENSHTIELGFSPGGHEVLEPYFYVKGTGDTPAAGSIIRATTLIGEEAPRGRLAAFLRHAINSRC